MGTEIGEPIQGHGGWVESVAWLPGGKCLVSGEYRRSPGQIRIWDAGV